MTVLFIELDLGPFLCILGSPIILTVTTGAVQGQPALAEGLQPRASGSSEPSCHTAGFRPCPRPGALPSGVGPLEGHEIHFWGHGQLFNKNEIQEDRIGKNYLSASPLVFQLCMGVPGHDVKVYFFLWVMAERFESHYAPIHGIGISVTSLVPWDS